MTGTVPPQRPDPAVTRGHLLDTATLEGDSLLDHGHTAVLLAGCLVDGRGFAAARKGGISPGHHLLPTYSAAGYAVDERRIGRRLATNRAGAAELLGRSIKTINLLASPKGRAEGSGFPEPIEVDTDGEWYSLTDLRRFRPKYLARVEAAGRARSHGTILEGDPEELLPAVDFQKAIDVPSKSWTKYVDISKPAWIRGEDGYLPRPDHEEPVVKGRGVTRYWKRRRVQDWINNRPGSNPSPGRPGQKQPQS